MKKFRVITTSEIFIDFDEESAEFKELFQLYRDHISESADYESFVRQIATYIARYGTSDLIEGVGYVLLNGEKQNIFVDVKYGPQDGYVNVTADVDINNMIEHYIDTCEEIND